MASRTAPGSTAVMGGSVALSWLGMVVHNVADLPELPLLTAEYLVPTAVSLVLFLAWSRSRRRRLAAALLLTWAVVMLVVGAILSVIPLDVWPFYPAQTFKHYFFHGVYGLTQLPLVVVAIREVRSPEGVRSAGDVRSAVDVRSAEDARAAGEGWAP